MKKKLSLLHYSSLCVLGALVCRSICFSKHWCMAGHMQHPHYSFWDYFNDILVGIFLVYACFFAGVYAWRHRKLSPILRFIILVVLSLVWGPFWGTDDILSTGRIILSVFLFVWTISNIQWFFRGFEELDMQVKRRF